jgi:hypothetical protein
MRVVVVLGIAGLLLAGCRGSNGDVPEAPATIARSSPPATVTPSDFESLRWLEGYWRGTGSGVPPFYESYEFVDDTTIVGFNYQDSTLTAVADSGRIMLSGGVLTSRGVNSLSTATSIDSTHVRFEMPEAGRSFTWTRVPPDAWSAHIEAMVLGERQERTYQMQRIAGPSRLPLD